MTSELIQNLLAEESNCRVVFLKLREARDHLEVECNKALHTLQMAKRKLYKASFPGNIMRDADGNRLMKLPASDTAECTRAVPDGLELVRYSLDHRGLFTSLDGDLTIYDEAAAIIAAKDAAYECMKIESSKHAHDAETVRRERDALIAELADLKGDGIAYAAGYYQAECNLPEHENAKAAVKEYREMRAELAQGKAQEPYGYIDGPHFSTEPIEGWIPLYAAPVDQTAEIERLREAFKLGWQSSETASVDDTWKDTFAYHYTDDGASLTGKAPL